MKISFENTENAFKYLKDKELKKANRIFSLLNNKKLSSIGKLVTMSAFDIGLPIKGLVKQTLFNAFVGGETLEESEPEMNMLQESNICVILDYGIEAKNEEQQLNQIADKIHSILEQIKSAQHQHVHTSAKISAFADNSLLEKVSSGDQLTKAEQELWQRVIERTDKVCRMAHEAKVQVYLDAEESWLQQAIDDLVELMMQRYNKEQAIVFQTIQLYRHDRLVYLQELHQRARDKGYVLAVKLVRGAYMEKERKRALDLGYQSPIQVSKEATDADYNKAVEYCIDHLDEICMCVASHNEESNYLLDEQLSKKGIKRQHPHILTAQLFGMGDHITFNMAKEGYNTNKYLPFGPVKELLPYLLRRANENSSVDGQASRELTLLKKEMKRRGLKSIF